MPKDAGGMYYYAVYFARFDGNLIYQDLLFELRRAYFEGGQRQKNKVMREYNGVDYRYSYVLETGSPLKWKKMSGHRLVEKSVPMDDGSYRIVTQDENRRMVKCTYFDMGHCWLKTEYFLPEERKLAASLAPLEDGSVLELKDFLRSGEGENACVLYPCEIPQDLTELNLLNSSAGIPDVLCKTNLGDFYFVKKEERERRKKVLEAIRSGNCAPRPLLIPERQEELMENREHEGGFTVHVDPPAPLPEEKELQELRAGVKETIRRYDEAVQLGDDVSNGAPVQEEHDSVFSSVEPEGGDETTEATVPLILGQQEKTGARRYNVFVQPMVKNPYGSTSLQEETASQPVLQAVESNNERAEKYSDALDSVYGQSPYVMKSVCSGAVNGCPYLAQGKMTIRVSDEESYYYFGEVIDNLREGRGRTAMQNGMTAYEGGYEGDRREGFGTYYYKSGKLCYAGQWHRNQRHGMGVSFRPNDGTVHVGTWKEDVPVGMGSRFDGEGNLLFAGRWENGLRQGAGISYHAKDGRILVGQWKDDVMTGRGTEFDPAGNLLYSGEWKDGERHGKGVEYDNQGEIVYSGAWKHGRYEGKGVLHRSDGHRVEGEFLAGCVSGIASEYDENEQKIYYGSWRDGCYEGTGCRYFPGGGRYEGVFHKGKPFGALEGYDANGALVYRGEWQDDEFSGKGCYYAGEEMVYEGNFAHNRYHGSGRAYEHGKCVYSGEFQDNLRSGFGVSFRGGLPEYAGQWCDDRYDGVGILYEEGEARYAGCFVQGKRHGRVNILQKGRVCAEGIYEDDALVYVRQYHPETGTLEYEGNLFEGRLSGMGCTYTPFGEKLEEGIFSGGRLVRGMKVSLKELPELPEAELPELQLYQTLRYGPEYAVEFATTEGIYSGQLKGGIPHGAGTLLCSDHRFTGLFKNGNPCGEGVVYRNDGTTLEGEFYREEKAETIPMQFADSICYYYRPATKKE